jgi:hypothetical protein
MSYVIRGSDGKHIILGSTGGNIIFSQPSELSLLSGLTAYWKLDETSGNVFDEISDYEGTVSGADLNQNGKIGKSIYFDRAVHDYITFGNLTEFNFGHYQDFSFSIWFKTSADLANQNLFSKYEGTWKGWGIWFDETKNLALYLNDADSSDTLFLHSGTGWQDGNWHLAIAVVDRDSSAKFYVDNVSYDPQGVTTGINLSTTNAIKLSFSSTPGYDYTGYLDEAAIWNRALSPTEVSTLYNNGIGLSYPFIT